MQCDGDIYVYVRFLGDGNGCNVMGIYMYVYVRFLGDRDGCNVIGMCNVYVRFFGDRDGCNVTGICMCMFASSIGKFVM